MGGNGRSLFRLKKKVCVQGSDNERSLLPITIDTCFYAC